MKDSCWSGKTIFEKRNNVYLVETLVKNRMMEKTVNPVDTKIGEHKEGSNTEEHVRDTSISLRITIKLGITLNFTPEPWDSEH